MEISKIKVVDEFKYLGMIISKNGRWTKYQKEMTREAEAYTAGWARFRYKEILVNLLNQMFDTLVQPIIWYEGEIWGDKCDNKITDKAGIMHCKHV